MTCSEDTQTNSMITLMLLYARMFIGTPYIYGGNGPYFDCSGFVQEVLSRIGVDPPGDQTAQALYYDLKSRGWPSRLGEGSILFYGTSRDKIKHVAIVLDDKNKSMIEAAGGDSTTLTISDAIKRGAMVRVRPLRSNFVAVLKPLVL